MRINKIKRKLDGTAKVFVRTTRSEDSRYTYAECNLSDRHWMTGWDLTDEGFEFNFDMSLCFDSSHFDNLKDYYQALESSIRNNTDLEFAKSVIRIDTEVA